MYNSFNDFKRPSRLQLAIRWIWMALIIPTLALIFSSVMFIMFVLSLPITWLWNHCWVPTFPAFHAMEFMTAFGILVMARLVVASVSK